MKLSEWKTAVEPEEVGKAIYSRIVELYPMCRSITGDGVRSTLEIIRNDINLEVHEVPTGTRVFDWSVPKEWNIRDAYVKDGSGERVIDFARSNLHVVSYSSPVQARMSLSELKPHLFTLPEHPDWIPYRTSYYEEQWGFCLTQRQLEALKEDTYEVCIDSSLSNGYLTYGEYYVPGESAAEVLISCHACHPSLCNDNLSGVSLVTVLAKALSRLSLRYSYRFLFIPGTIGSITWLARNEGKVSRIQHGLIVAGVGDSGGVTYKRSRRGDAEIDRVVSHVLKHSGQPYGVRDFSPWGYDERQFCSPGFNLPVGLLSRTPHGQFAEYHTSADNLDFVQPAFLGDSFMKLATALDVLENNKRYVNQNPKCEPQLGRRGIYRSVGGQSQGPASQLAMLWVLNLSDGRHSLLDVADRAGMEFERIRVAADILAEHGLLKEASRDAAGAMTCESLNESQEPSRLNFFSL